MPEPPVILEFECVVSPSIIVVCCGLRPIARNTSRRRSIFRLCLLIPEGAVRTGDKIQDYAKLGISSRAELAGISTDRER